MDVKAKLSMVRIAPRKVSLMVDQIRGKNVNLALNILRVSKRKKTADVLSTLLKSAVANADNKGTIDVDTLYVKEILVGQGPTLKRFQPVAKGAAHPIMKRTSHVKVVLSER